MEAGCAGGWRRHGDSGGKGGDIGGDIEAKGEAATVDGVLRVVGKEARTERNASNVKARRVTTASARRAFTLTGRHGQARPDRG